MGGQHCEYYDVERETVYCLTPVVLDLRVHLNWWPDAVAGISARFQNLLLINFAL